MIKLFARNALLLFQNYRAIYFDLNNSIIAIKKTNFL
jgi:hypothetical protein